MANQAIALQARAPQGNFLAPVIQQAGQMANRMAQQQALDRQTAVAQQQMELAKAKEGREAAMAPAQQAEAGAKAGSAKVKYVSDFMETSALALANVRDPQQAMAVGDRLKQLFPEPEFQQSVNETIAYLTEDPAQFDARRQESLVRTLDAKDQLAKTFETQKSGTQQRTIQYSPYGGAATEVPGSRFDTAQDIQYVKGPDDSVRAMPKNMPGTGGFGAPAPVAPAAGLVGGARGGALGPSIEQAAQRLSPGLVVSGRARTPERNAQVGGVPDSFHKTDNARDFQPGKGQTLTGLYNSLAPLKAQGFDVIKERNHVHVEPSPGKAPAPRGGAGGLQFGQVVPGMGGKPPKAKEPAISPEKKLARDTAVQNLYDSVINAQAKGHLVAGDKSYAENRAQELLEGRTYLPGGTAKKTSIDDINAAATQLLRMFIEKGTSGTLNTKSEQELFLRSVGGANATYETRLKTIRNFAKQNGIMLDDYADAGKPPASGAKTSTSKMSAETRAKYGL